MNCKPGDLAIVVGRPRTPDLVGRIVEVVRPIVPDERLGEYSIPVVTGGLPAWVVRSNRAIPLLTGMGRLFWVTERSLADYLLRPISGIPINDEVTEEITA